MIWLDVWGVCFFGGMGGIIDGWIIFVRVVRKWVVKGDFGGEKILLYILM